MHDASHPAYTLIYFQFHAARVNVIMRPSCVAACLGQSVPERFPQDNWRRKAKPIQSGSTYPAKENCSKCGLCDTYFIAHVKEACAFLGNGMSDIPSMEEKAHGRSRNLDDKDELLFGVTEDIFYARSQPPVPSAQWSGIVTRIAVTMLEKGEVDAVVCVQSQEDDRMGPKPVVARTVEDILASKGVKPCLSPNLEVLATVEAVQAKRLLFIGVGCQVQAIRAIEPYLDVDTLYVLGTNCVDNGPRAGLDKFLNAASQDPGTVKHYEFVQDYRVHLKHDDGSYEKVPYFCLPPRDLVDVIAPSCYSCFDYTNAGADVVVGYMGVPADRPTPIHQQYQNVTVRNKKGQHMIDVLKKQGYELDVEPPATGGLLPREVLVEQTVVADDQAKLGMGPEQGAPKWLGEIIAAILTTIGPRGLEFAKYSIEYHYLRNFIHVSRHWPAQQGQKHVPEFAKRVVARYDTNGAISKRYAMPFHGVYASGFERWRVIL